MEMLTSGTGPNGIYTNNMINSEMLSQISDARQLGELEHKGETSKEDMSEFLKKMLTEHKKITKKYEKDDKKYKALQSFGYALNEIKGLLDMIPTDNEELSLEELIETLEKLTKSRTFVASQLNFTFYQDLYTNAMNELLEIESHFQDGSLCAADAVKKVRQIRDKVTGNFAEIPMPLRSMKDQVEGLVSNYEGLFGIVDEEEKSKGDVISHQAGLRLNSAIMFNELNLRTHSLINDLYIVRKGLSMFDPAVNLDFLKKKMQGAQDLINQDEWSADSLNDEVNSIKNITTHLTSEQRQKNWERDYYKSKIQRMNEDAKKFALEAKLDTARNIVKQSTERIENAENVTTQVEAVTESANGMPTAMAQQVTETVRDQLSADRTNIREVLADPEVQSEPEVACLIKLCSEKEIIEEEEKLEELEAQLAEKTEVTTLQYATVMPEDESIEQ